MKKIGMIKRCNVTKDHFEGLKSDYYYLMSSFYNINEKDKEIVYEVAPIKIILSKEGDKSYKNPIMIIAICVGVFVSIIIVIAIVVFCVRKKKGSDLEVGIVNGPIQNEELLSI